MVAFATDGSAWPEMPVDHNTPAARHSSNREVLRDSIMAS
jgi:hypothetical protein